MSFLGFILLGLIAGAIASAILKNRAPGGFWATLVVGVIGAIIGGWIGTLITGDGLGNFFSIQAWVLAILGSLIVLWIYGALSGRKR